MGTRNLWSKILTVAGGMGMAVGAFDPLEGWLLILPGSGLLALGVWLSQAERQAVACKVCAFVLIVIGVGAMWGLSAVGGFGGTSGRSGWWGLLLLPYLIGWSMGIWGPGSHLWLALLGIVLGLWWLWLAFAVAGAVGAMCGIIGALTVGGCIYRVVKQLKARATTPVA